MNLLNNLTGFPAVLVALTAAIMWGTWFISLKYLKEYPIEAFYVVMFAFSLVFVWGVGFLLEGKALLENIALVGAQFPWKIVCTLVGGMCAARNGACFAILPLPVGGLMSLEPCAAVVPQVERVEQAMQSLCDKPFSLLDIAIYALPVVPGLVITDRGVVDGISQTFVEYIKPCEAKSNG